ncbi:TonB-dependent siderophore receptor [Shewanella intestini]|uniref:TonB-dependent siderophore receptor n=1 Tax=Shewanella intestini TaxID=2017544 RepID=A0ABS5I297_9GAMM|nr:MULTISPECIES: TonB-dependent siderophore receptor [Shewanella]MBR9728145.1 TonB-dependent siderophore receptor [Shewanella intestini]
MNQGPFSQQITPLTLAIFVALSVPTVATAAQQPSSAQQDVEVIQVKGLRKAYRGNTQEQDLPQSISSLSFDTLQATGITGLQDSLDLISGVTRQNDFGGLWDMFAIRGFAGDENLPSAYLINGFSAGRGFSGNRDMSNVEVMEVIKGPSSALYGRGEPGGTVNIITKKPQFDQHGYIKFTAGSFNSYRTEADFTTGITDDIAFRMNGAYEDAQSYRDTITSKKTVLTPSFLYQLSDDTVMSYELEYLNQQTPMDRGVVVVEGKDFSSSNFYGETADGPVEIAAMGHQFELQHDFAGDWAMNAGLSYRTSSFEGSVTEPRWYDADTDSIIRQRRYRDFDAKDLSGRIEFSGSAQAMGLQHNLLVGADAYDYQLDRIILRYRHNTAAVGSPESDPDYYAIDFDNPEYRDVLPEMIDNTSDLEKQRGQGVYLQDQIDLATNWKLMLGVRYDNFSQDITYRLDDDRTTSITKSYVNPRAGLVYSLSDSTRLYASYSEGARPNSGTDASGNGHDPEESKSYEVGFKWDLAAQDFSGTLALFSTEKANILASSPKGDGTTEAIGKAKSNGLELDMSYKLTPDTDVSLAYAYIDAQNAKEITLWDWYIIEEGARLNNVPEHSGSLMVRQYMQWGQYEGSGGFVVQYVGTQLGDFLEQDYELPNYTLVNLFANVKLSHSLELNLNINNLLDEEYYANSYSSAWTMPGEPRSFKASIKYLF